MTSSLYKVTAINHTRYKFRWTIVVLLFFATTINYLDRQILGVLAPTLTKIFKWSETDYAFLVSAFKWVYAIGLFSVGWLLDKIGTKKGFSISITIWSIAGMLHAACSSVGSFAIARFMLGIGEAGNYPGCIKAIAAWFPKKERAFATGLFNSGSNIGAIGAPLLIPWLTITYSWRAAFVVTGLVGFIWLLCWWIFYDQPERQKKVKAEELKYIQQDTIITTLKIPLQQLLHYRTFWIIALTRFITDPVWWFFLFWLPKFLDTRHHVTLTALALPLIIIYLFADLGSVFGGWLSSHFIKKGKTADRVRKDTILISSPMVLPVSLAAVTHNLWISVILISLATAAHQRWAANIFTIVSDIFPEKAVATVIGFSGTAGAVGGALAALAVGFLLGKTGSYLPAFIIFSFMYFIAWLLLKLFVPVRPLEGF